MQNIKIPLSIAKCGLDRQVLCTGIHYCRLDAQVPPILNFTLDTKLVAGFYVY